MVLVGSIEPTLVAQIEPYLKSSACQSDVSFNCLAQTSNETLGSRLAQTLFENTR